MPSHDIEKPRWDRGPYSKHVVSKSVDLNMGELFLISWKLLRADPLELRDLPRRIFHPGIFASWLHTVLHVNFDTAKQQEREEWSDSYKVRPRFLVGVVASMLKYQAKRPRREVLRYLTTVERLELLEVDTEDDEWWVVNFPDEEDYIDVLANMKRELVEVWDKVTIKHYGRLIQHSLVQPWSSFMPNRLTFQPNVGGRINLAYVKPQPMTARRWALYSWTIYHEHFAAIEAGAADHNPYSDKPEQRRRTRCGVVVDNDSRTQDDRREVEGYIQDDVEATKPGRETWPIGSAKGAWLTGVSFSTYKRRLSHLITVSRIPQAIKLGPPIHISRIKEVMEPFAKRVADGTLPRFPRLQPVDRDLFCLQWDRPNRYRYRGNKLFWKLVEVPPELQVGEALREELEGTEGTKEVVKTTVHDPALLPGEVFPKVKVLKSNVVKLEYLPQDLRDPSLWDELTNAGFDVFPGFYRKRVRVPLRGSHRRGEKVKGTALQRIKDLNAKEHNKQNPITRKRKQDEIRRSEQRSRVVVQSVLVPPAHPRDSSEVCVI